MKKYVAAPVALLAGVALAIPMADAGTVRATTVITQCPAGIASGPYCSTATITTPDLPTTTGTPTTSSEASSGGVVAASKTQIDNGTAAAAAALPKKADGSTPKVTFIGQVGDTLVFIPADSPGLADLASGKATSLTVFVITALSDGTYSVVPTLYLHKTAGTRRDVAIAAAHTNPLSTSKINAKAGQAVPVKIKLTKKQRAAIKRAKVAKLLTKVTVTDDSGSHTTYQLQTMNLG